MKIQDILVSLLIGLNGVDAGFTAAVAIAFGPQIEGNPIMRAPLLVSPFLFLAAKLGLMTGLMAVWSKMVAPRANRVTLATLAAVTAGYTFLDLRNAVILMHAASQWR